MKKSILVFCSLALFMLLSCQNSSKHTDSQPTNKSQQAVIDNIMTRTSIRQFKQQPVEPGKVDTLLRAAMAAPTAMNRQPWHFIVVTDTMLINQLAGPRPTNAPLMIAICGNMDKTFFPDDNQSSSKRKMPDFWVQDVSAATENLLLAAHALGLGAVWTGAYPDQQRSQSIANILGAPSNIIPLAVVRIGYPDESPQPKDKFTTENISYNSYGKQQ